MTNWDREIIGSQRNVSGPGANLPSTVVTTTLGITTSEGKAPPLGERPKLTEALMRAATDTPQAIYDHSIPKLADTLRAKNISALPSQLEQAAKGLRALATWQDASASGKPIPLQTGNDPTPSIIHALYLPSLLRQANQQVRYKEGTESIVALIEAIDDGIRASGFALAAKRTQEAASRSEGNGRA